MPTIPILWAVAVLVVAMTACTGRGEGAGEDLAQTPIQPATEPVFAEEPDYSQYPEGIAGFTGMNLQQVARWELWPAMRARIGDRGLYKAAIARLSSGDIVVASCYADEEDVFWIKVFRSQDEGRTWQQVGTKGATLIGKEPGLTCLENGTLLLDTQVMGAGATLFRSADGGTTWTEPECDLSMYTRNVIEQADGSLLLFDATSRLCSTDDGRTWPEREQFVVADAPDFDFAEAAIMQLADQHLLATVRISGEAYEVLTDDLISELPEFRNMPTREECSNHMVLLESQDAGLHWSKPRSFLNYAEVQAYLLPLTDGRLLATYTNYHLPFGSSAVLSEDNGRTWDTGHPIQLSMSLASHAGWANSIQLPDGDILTVYATSAYLEGAGHDAMTPGRDDTATEVIRWRLPDR